MASRFSGAAGGSHTPQQGDGEAEGAVVAMPSIPPAVQQMKATHRSTRTVSPAR